MNQDSLRELLDDAMPATPLAYRTPPLDGIRRRVRRRRVAVRVSSAAAALAVLALGAQVVRAATKPFPPSTTNSPSATGAAGGWTFAVVSADERDVVVVKEGPGATVSCAGTIAIEPAPSSAPIHVAGDQVVLPIPEATLPGCAYRLPFRLDAPLGTRTVVDSASQAPLFTLDERLLPRPVYPSGISLDSTNTNIVGNAPRPAWIVLYHLPEGYTITVTAVPADQALAIQVQEQVSAHGRSMQILTPLMGGTRTVAWTEDGWQITLEVDPAEHRPLSRDELQRVIDNLVWP